TYRLEHNNVRRVRSIVSARERQPPVCDSRKEAVGDGENCIVSQSVNPVSRQMFCRYRITLRVNADIRHRIDEDVLQLQRIERINGGITFDDLRVLYGLFAPGKKHQRVVRIQKPEVLQDAPWVVTFQRDVRVISAWNTAAPAN